MRIKVLLTDDHGVVRQSLQAFLTLDPEIEVVATAENGAQTIELVKEHQPNIAVLDLVIPGDDTIATIAKLRRLSPDLKILVLTSYLDEANIKEVLKAGASGYLLKTMHADALRNTIKTLVNGQILIAPEAAQLLINKSGAENNNTAVVPPADNGRFAAPELLTEREIRVLTLVAQGKSNKEIARDLQISEGTVKTHVSIILAKLGLQSRTQAALYATTNGLVPKE
jgi:two-component system, NarL family, response regulator LiaR